MNATTWPRQRVEHDAAYRLQTSAPPTVTGSGFVSTWMEAAPGTVVPAPGKVEFQWRCGSSLLGTKGPRLYLADYLDGCQVSVQQTSTLDGYASSVAVSAPVTVRSLRALTPGSVRAAVAGQRMAPAGVTWNLAPSRVSLPVAARRLAGTRSHGGVVRRDHGRRGPPHGGATHRLPCAGGRDRDQHDRRQPGGRRPFLAAGPCDGLPPPSGGLPAA
ncbi:hypothetical protein G5V59_12250 [Nocardioides sp. W3-2-3]|uniref:hypothetical protein n=1 Tax=Nocardioides convexus TaxID=2712224 RepID=UPI00241875C7|nr:hypothetical protein [Nocardioides convexus]NHA00535.1 hypothetical protein [Nocardioides convexus]